MTGHNDKPNIVKYHPTAKGVLASAAMDLTIKIWDVDKAKDLITLNGLTDSVRILNTYWYICCQRNSYFPFSFSGMKCKFLCL